MDVSGQVCLCGSMEKVACFGTFGLIIWILFGFFFGVVSPCFQTFPLNGCFKLKGGSKPPFSDSGIFLKKSQSQKKVF